MCQTEVYYVQPERHPHAPHPQPTLADLLDQIFLGDQFLPPRRRQDLASGLRTFAKAMGCRLEDLPADPGVLRQHRKFAPAMASLSAQRWRNILSLLRFALAHASRLQVPGRHWGHHTICTGTLSGYGLT